jgi:hypothetical protein
VSASFVAQLRSTRRPIILAEPGPGTITIRVEVAELWDAVRVLARSDTRVAELKRRVLAELFPKNQYPDEFMLKFRGWEILDDQGTLADCGVGDGAILLLGYRRRRAVR